jgi:hypothetical protein
LILKWWIETVGKDGFEFGLDMVTPVTWRLFHSHKPSNAYRCLGLPEPFNNHKYKEWLKENNKKEIIASMAELQAKIVSLRNNAIGVTNGIRPSSKRKT